MDKDKVIKILDMISEDAENDAKNFDVKEFNGKTVAEYFGRHGASINALARMLKGVIEEMKGGEDV